MRGLNDGFTDWRVYHSACKVMANGGEEERRGAGAFGFFSSACEPRQWRRGIDPPVLELHPSQTQRPRQHLPDGRSRHQQNASDRSVKIARFLAFFSLLPSFFSFFPIPKRLRDQIPRSGSRSNYFAFQPFFFHLCRLWIPTVGLAARGLGGALSMGILGGEAGREGFQRSSLIGETIATAAHQQCLLA